MTTVKDISNYVLIMEQRLEDRIKAHSRNWLIAAGVATIVLILLFFTLFKKQKQPTNYNSEIKSLDSTIKYQGKTIETLQVYKEQQDSAINHLNEALENNRTKQVKIIHEYEKIPNVVHDLNREQLRTEVTNY